MIYFTALLIKPLGYQLALVKIGEMYSQHYPKQRKNQSNLIKIKNEAELSTTSTPFSKQFWKH